MRVVGGYGMVWSGTVQCPTKKNKVMASSRSFFFSTNDDVFRSAGIQPPAGRVGQFLVKW